MGRSTRQSRTSMGGCQGPRPHVPGRRGAIRARKSNEGDLYRARNRVCSGSDLPALTPKASEMISESSRSRNPAGHTGLLQNLFALASALAEFFESRFALLAEESKTAAVQVLILVGCLIFALLLCAVGYVFLITGVVVGLAHLAGISYAVFCLKKKKSTSWLYRERVDGRVAPAAFGSCELDTSALPICCVVVVTPGSYVIRAAVLEHRHPLALPTPPSSDIGINAPRVAGPLPVVLSVFRAAPLGGGLFFPRPGRGRGPRPTSW